MPLSFFSAQLLFRLVRQVVINPTHLPFFFVNSISNTLYFKHPFSKISQSPPTGFVHPSTLVLYGNKIPPESLLPELISQLTLAYFSAKKYIRHGSIKIDPATPFPAVVSQRTFPPIRSPGGTQSRNLLPFRTSPFWPKRCEVFDVTPSSQTGLRFLRSRTVW